jgi:hypothetical protein
VRRRVPLVLVLGLTLELVGMVARHLDITSNWDAFRRSDPDVVTSILRLLITLGAPAPLLLAIGAWQLRAHAGGRPRRVALAIASIGMGIAIGTTVVEGVLLRLLVEHEWWRDATDLVDKGLPVVLAAAAVALAFGAERRVLVAAVAALAIVLAAYLQLRSPGGDTPLALTTRTAPPLVLLAIAIRARSPREPDPMRAAVGLHRLSRGLWWYAIISCVQALAVFILASSDALELDSMGWIFAASATATILPLGWALGGVFTAADARAGAAWRLAIGASVLAFVNTNLQLGSWLTLAIVPIGPSLLGSALVALAHRGQPRTVLVTVFAAIAVLTGAWLAVVLIAPAPGEQRLVFSTVLFGYVVAHGAGVALLARAAKYDARLLEHDPTALDHVFV